MGVSRQEYWRGLQCPSPGDLPDLGIKPVSLVALALQVDSLPLSYWGSPLSSLVNTNVLVPPPGIPGERPRQLL